MGPFERSFRKLLQEDQEACCSSFRTDKVGNRIEVPYGGSFQIGENGRGVGIPKGHTAKLDKTGQLHVLAPGQVLKIGANGRGIVICPGESTSEKSGQIVVNRKKTKNESRRPSCLELLQRPEFLAEG